MEAFAAIGLTGNLIQFVDYAVKAMSRVYELYTSASGATRANQDIEFLTRSMKDLTSGLSINKPLDQLSKTEESLNRLVMECRKWTDDLLALLDKIKTRHSRSRLEAVKAMVRNIRKNDDKMRLEKGLASCRQQLDVHLAHLARIETSAKLDEIIKLSESREKSMEALMQNTCNLRAAVNATSLSGNALNDINSVFTATDDIVLQFWQRKVLDALQSNATNERYIAVEPAHAKTFEWLFDDTQDTCTTELAQGREDEALSSPVTPNHDAGSSRHRHPYFSSTFVRWLRQGQGIFHISGKPGAGKSTLVKFACEHTMAKKHLKYWAKDDKLLFAKAFFWKLGTAPQMNLRGMLCSILYEIVQQAPELAVAAFPRPNDVKDAYAKLDFSTAELEEAFASMIVQANKDETHKFAVFIDALDEYSGDHAHTTEKLIHWAELGNAQIKILISSREWPVFTTKLEKYPKLRVQELTHGDISMFIRDRSATWSTTFDTIRSDEVSQLSEMIANKAEEVFLWVKLVLQEIESGLFNGDGFRDSARKLASLPTELQDLFQHLFDSIPESDRLKASTSFQICIAARRLYSYFNEVDDQYLYSGSASLPLLRFWFIDELLDNENFTICSHGTESTQTTINRYVNITRRQIIGRCKGFLELREDKHTLLNEGAVGFMHATVVEFLHQKHIASSLISMIRHDRVLGLFRESLLADIKYLPRAEYNSSDPGIQREPNFIAELKSTINECVRHFDSESPETHKKTQKTKLNSFLSQMDMFMAKRYADLQVPRSWYVMLGYGQDKSIHVGISSRKEERVSNAALITCLAAYCRLWEYLDHKRHCLLFMRRCDQRSGLVCVLFSLVPQQRHYRNHIRTASAFEVCFQSGMSLNGPLGHEDEAQGDEKYSLFDRLLLVLACDIESIDKLSLDSFETNDSDPKFYRPMELIALFLRYGAVSSMRIEFERVEELDSMEEGARQMKRNPKLYPFKNVQDSVVVTFYPVIRCAGLHETKKLYRVMSDSSTKFVQYALRRGGKLSFKDLLKFWFPRNYAAMLAMLETNEKLTSSEVRGTQIYPLPFQPEAEPVGVLFPSASHRMFPKNTVTWDMNPPW
ncbi:hypothetical protein JX265_001776 [Neoarthrinium moseri]|uniref:NACHT domain-containing protein n=1 Tax=Neoarthrinium moseri TaxID=1658444 RepID=A0A9P9WW28_9PEZI|nr:hypothetical protein JX265_001776 [Neoarthrinium moseri]